MGRSVNLGLRQKLSKVEGRDKSRIWERGLTTRAVRRGERNGTP